MKRDLLLHCMAHFYKAGRQTQVLGRWEGMVLLLATHVSTRPRSEVKSPVVSKVSSKANSDTMGMSLCLAIDCKPSKSDRKWNIKMVREHAHKI